MKISIIGSGAYGLALGTMFELNNNQVTIWSKFPEEVDNLNRNRKFKDINLSKNIEFTSNIEKCLNNSDLIVIALPVAFINTTMPEIKKYYNNHPILVASKGIEQNTNLFAIDIVKKYINTNNIGVISGATFATDMLKKEPMGLTLATNSNILEKLILQTLKNKYLDIQITNDIIGVEICGSIKNIIAIASGIIDGYGYGDSSKYLFITKSIYIVKQLIKEFNGLEETILTYAGIDDIYMTCTSNNSRNFTLGRLIGSNKEKKEIDNYKNRTTIEGLYTTKSFYELLKNININCPLINIIYNILYNNNSSIELINYLKED